MLLLILSAATGYSQENSHPKLFSHLPDEIALSTSTLRDAFSSRDGETVSLPLSSNFNFSGVVISNQVKYHNLRSIIIKSPAFSNSLFHLSQITNEDNSISYVGRIINTNAFDGYEIRKNAAGNYAFRKFETKKILQDCNQ